MIKDIERVFFSEDELKNRVGEMGAAISADYAGKFPLMIGVLKGCFVFMADLMRNIDISCEVDFMAVASYGNDTRSSGAVRITKDLTRDIENRHVILIEDILDSGITLTYLKNYLLNRNPASLAICTLLDKPARRQAPIDPDYVGFECPDEFVVGYGLDYAEKYRNLPYIGVLKESVYS